MTKTALAMLTAALVAASSAYAGVFDLLVEGQGSEELARCGEVPAEPSLYDKTFRTKKLEARDAHQQCMRRLEVERQQRTKQNIKDHEKLVFDIHESCHASVRRMSRAPETLSFNPYRYDMATGYNGAGESTLRKAATPSTWRALT